MSPEQRTEPGPPVCPDDLRERMGADVLERVEERWASDHRALGQCLVWTGVVDSRGEYGRLYDPAIKRTDYTHRIAWRRVFGPIPDGLEVDEVCAVSLCVRPDHLQLLTKGDNGRARHTRDAGRVAQGRSKPAAPTSLTIALFESVYNTTPEQRTVSLDELAAMLSQFEVLGDKHQGHCWSPAKYADGAMSRGNVGVLALVFDLDRVPSDPARLAHVQWFGRIGRIAH